MANLSIYDPHKFIGAGQPKMRLAGAAAPLRDVGHSSAIDTTPEVDEKSIPNRRGGGGENWNQKILDKLTMKVVFEDVDAAKLAMVQNASVTDNAAGSITAEPYVAYAGGFIPMKFIDTATVVVQDETDTTTYVEDTDYSLSNTGITIAASGGTIGEGDTIHVSSDLLAETVIQAFVNSGEEYEFYVDGINDAETDDYYYLHAFKWKPDPTSINWISADPMALEVSGSILTDDSRPLGESKLMVIGMSKDVA